jgi:glycine betaine/proline transport system substrate-binding protein
MTKTMTMKGLLASAATVAMIAAPGLADAAEEPGAGTTVKMARANWDTGWFQAEVYKQMLMELGYEIPRTITLDNPPFYKSVAQGDMHLWVNGWFPLHDSYADDFEDGAERVGYVAQGGALQGYLVDKKTAEELDITTIQDFKRDDVKEAFDNDGDGKAEMVACPPGWGCEKTISYHMEAYDLQDHVDPIKASYSASMADALGRYKNGGSIFFYTWTPNWTVGLLKPGKDVVWITVDETKLPGEQTSDETTVSGLEGCVTDPCNLGWVANDIRPVANSEFLDENPAVETLLKEARIPIADIFAQNAKMNQGEDSNEDITMHAKNWVEDNRDKVDSWLSAARAAAE